MDDAFAGLVPAIQQHYGGLDTLIHVSDEDPPPGVLGYEALVA